jgi:ribosome-binding protein aMBF1 (putative translation factor)
MITNERQYRIARAEAQRFEHALMHGDEQGAQIHPRLRQAMREGLESQLMDLRAQVAEYEALRGGHVAVLEFDTLTALPDALIRARTAAGVTQKELAARLGIKEQQVQRYEATRYAGANLERMQAVAEALGVTIHERVTLPAAHDDNAARAARLTMKE